MAIIAKIDQETFREDDGYAFMAESYFMQLWGMLARESGVGYNPERHFGRNSRSIPEKSCSTPIESSIWEICPR